MKWRYARFMDVSSLNYAALYGAVFFWCDIPYFDAPAKPRYGRAMSDSLTEHAHWRRPAGSAPAACARYSA
ncbi:MULTISPECIES: hypothetical protein [Nguyenibacter]|uniref:Uncharacterized protein n=1 Tax=Nguyenibacter vanlangensis TaxID=1216886 RepID=A0A7Y7IXW2_9PROT|nr:MULTISPECIES: hypothetical protein [Nguyenibacter]NVN12389.1 hypothetical protein [Nguyenibacter vanlangensis]WRH86662.1 hypothetical protein QN315_11605 [Nguyenibacter sp. L1]